MVARIKAEPEVRRMDRVQEPFQGVRGFFEDVFNSNDKVIFLRLHNQGAPCLKAAFEPAIHVFVKLPFLIAGMEDDRLRSQEPGACDRPGKPIPSHFFDPSIHSSGAKVHEGTVDRHFKPLLLKDMGYMLDIVLAAGVEIPGAKINLGVDSVLSGKINPVEKHGKRDIDLNRGHLSLGLEKN